MKQFAFSVVALLMASISTAMASFTFCIGSEGVDRYADGTPVLPGERYGLVYVAPGKAFDGVYSDGTLKNTVDDALFPVAVRADEKSSLPICHYEMDDAYAGGTFYLVVFDTRTPDGGVNGSVINGWGTAASLSVASSSAGATRTGGHVASLEASAPAVASSAATLAPSVPANAGIEKMEITDDAIVLTVRNTGSAAYYAAAGADALDGSAFESAGFKNAVTGNPDGMITVSYPKNSNARFFKVKGGTLMNL